MCALCDRGKPQLPSTSRRNFLKGTAVTGLAAGAIGLSGSSAGHLHVRVDDLPWLWADASDNNTVDIAGMPPGPHKVQIVFPGQSRTVTFTVPPRSN